MTDDEGGVKIPERNEVSVSQAMNDRPKAGLWGPDGLLAVPHVKMVVFLAGLYQVTRGMGMECICTGPPTSSVTIPVVYKFF